MVTVYICFCGIRAELRASALTILSTLHLGEYRRAIRLHLGRRPGLFHHGITIGIVLLVNIVEKNSSCWSTSHSNGSARVRRPIEAIHGNTI